MNDEAHKVWPTLSPFYYQPELFNLVQTINRDEQFYLAEPVLEQFRRRFCDQQ